MSVITNLPDLAPSLGIEMSVVEITPSMAKEWLGRNYRNRDKVVHRIPPYSRDMENGLWLLDGSPIRFSKAGRLLDGQNRLYAIIASNTTINSVVITGLSDESQKVMDTGSARSLGQHLKMVGVTSAASCAATAGFIERWDRGVRRNVASGAGGKFGTLSEANQAFWENRDLIEEAVRTASRVTKRHPRIMSPSVLAGMSIVFGRLDQEDAAEYLRLMCSEPADLPGSNHPVAAFITQMQRENEREGSRGPDWKLGMLIKSWNAWREGYETPTLRYNPGGKRCEQFPEPL